jgi:hypothetical protein
MRSIVLSSLAATLTCSTLALACVACVDEERTPAARPGTTTVVTSQPRPVVNTAPIVNNVVEPPVPAPAPTTVNVAPPAYGATESQPDERTRATEMVALAQQQIDRLRRIQAVSSDAYREDIDASVSDLQSKRGRVLQDLRELEMRPAGRSQDIQVQLAADAINLQEAMRASEAIAPSPSQGLPQPSPLTPSQVR